MNAVEFIKQYGWDLAQRDVVCLETGFITKADFLEHYGFEILDDLKQLVDAWGLVDAYGGLDSCYEKLHMLHELTENPEPIREAIELVESVNENN